VGSVPNRVDSGFDDLGSGEWVERRSLTLMRPLPQPSRAQCCQGCTPLNRRQPTRMTPHQHFLMSLVRKTGHEKKAGMLRHQRHIRHKFMFVNSVPRCCLRHLCVAPPHRLRHPLAVCPCICFRQPFIRAGALPFAPAIDVSSIQKTPCFLKTAMRPHSRDMSLVFP
jgi:hypothetical protein